MEEFALEKLRGFVMERGSPLSQQFQFAGTIRVCAVGDRANRMRFPRGVAPRKWRRRSWASIPTCIHIQASREVLR